MSPTTGPWRIYDELIEGVPEGIRVLDCCLGRHWAYVSASCGCGIGHLVPGGARSTAKGDVRQHDLRSLCKLVKSWNFPEATLGVAALNAWYSQVDKIEELGGRIDTESPMGKNENPFHALTERYADKKIAVVGHFPNVESMFETSQVTVLERNCTSPLDTPDSASEYLLPEQDFVFMTGTTLVNKTMPRLLELAQGTTVAVVGPSATPATAMKNVGVNIVAGSAVVDPEVACWSIRGNDKDAWRKGIKKFYIEW